MIFVGRDLHKRYITACALDAEGALLAAARRLPADGPVLAAWLTALPTPRTVVGESCLYGWWLERQLTAAGDTGAGRRSAPVEAHSHKRAKTDPIDARKLADLARAHVLPALWVPDPHTRARRQALRGRSFSCGSALCSRIACTTTSRRRTSTVLPSGCPGYHAHEPVAESGRIGLGALDDAPLDL